MMYISVICPVLTRYPWIDFVAKDLSVEYTAYLLQVSRPEQGQSYKSYIEFQDPNICPVVIS